MAKEAVFTLKLEPELRDAFMAEAAASQIVRELMKDYLRRREEEKRGYDEFLRRKVARARASIAAGRTYTQEEVEAQSAARRERFLRMADEAGK